MVLKMRKQDDGLYDLINSITLNDMTAIEVGSYAGESADIFCQSGKIKDLWCVDPWKNGYNNIDIASRKSDFAEVENAFNKVAEKHYDIIHKFKGTFKEFAERFEQIKPDLIYIDANHSYEACKEDIQTALSLNPKIISGHDYVEDWKGVIKAVDELLGKPDMTFKDGSWLKYFTLIK